MTTNGGQHKGYQLAELIKGIAELPDAESTVTVTAISCDSREVVEGALFVAICGVASDGAKFIPQAIEKGASVIVCDANAEVTVPQKIPVLRVDNPRKVLSQLAARFYTPQPSNIVAVTGTNGKTSTAHFCKEIWQNLRVAGASIGTIGVRDTEGVFAASSGASLTTPDPVKLHQNLVKLADSGVQHVAMEASSHGLSQYRLHGVHIQAAGFTNLSRDHLDYHKTEEAYLQAKLLLFTEILPSGSVAVVNADTQVASTVIEACQARKHRVITYGRQPQSDLHIHEIVLDTLGQTVHFSFMGASYHATVPLIGEFQIENLMCALLLVYASGTPADRAVSALPEVASVPGRMQLVSSDGNKGGVVVDYAHTPDALEKALQQLRPYVKEQGRLWVVFGCGGDRDAGKRPLMGVMAEQLADEVIVTDDNPRTEEAASIRAQIIEACLRAKNIADRREAIHYAIDRMGAGDMLLIAGKGHENYQIIGETSHNFDDVEVALEKLKG